MPKAKPKFKVGDKVTYYGYVTTVVRAVNSNVSNDGKLYYIDPVSAPCDDSGMGKCHDMAWSQELTKVQEPVKKYNKPQRKAKKPPTYFAWIGCDSDGIYWCDGNTVRSVMHPRGLNCYSKTQFLADVEGALMVPLVGQSDRLGEYWVTPGWEPPVIPSPSQAVTPSPTPHCDTVKPSLYDVCLFRNGTRFMLLDKPAYNCTKAVLRSHGETV